MLAPGFVLLFISVLGLLKSSPSKGLLTVSGMEMWKIPFIAVMTLANLGFLVVLAVFARRNRLHIPAALYILSALAMLAMGYLSTQAFTTGMHWLAQSVNSLVQLLAMARHIALYRGLSTEAPTTHSVATS